MKVTAKQLRQKLQHEFNFNVYRHILIKYFFGHSCVGEGKGGSFCLHLVCEEMEVVN